MKLSNHQISVLKKAAFYEKSGLSWSILSDGIRHVSPLFRKGFMYQVISQNIKSRKLKIEYKLTDDAYNFLSTI